MNAELHGRIAAAQRRIHGLLRSSASAAGAWEGELSSSALSTATAVLALATLDRQAEAQRIRRGLEWLATHENADGGWGDTIRSESNLSTTALVWAAFGAAAADADSALGPAAARAKAYLVRAAGSLDQLVPAIEARYGSDRTFSVPITMTLALSGRLGPDGWRRVRPLPFELAALPRGFFGALRLPVVSYALPALIAIGQVIYHHRGGFYPLRKVTRRRTLAVLETLQPENGGFLEATPLTSFVTMSLAGMGLGSHPVTQRGAAFLRRSVRPDGSWPIDTNLSTWVTTLAIKAMAGAEEGLPAAQGTALRDWLLNQQYRVVHPYTGAPPGGWAWTDLPGGVPDADDTSGALLALSVLPSMGADAALRSAVDSGVDWLLNLQNGDGGIPTFCRGWGTLPFDRSTPEITAHVLRAWQAWLPTLSPSRQASVARATQGAMRYLKGSQRPDGAWVPLWFGNERAPQRENPVYGTAQVLTALVEPGLAGLPETGPMVSRAVTYLQRAQEADGGWGGDTGVPSSVEETAVVLGALAGIPHAAEAVTRGAEWLLRAWEAPVAPEPSPIGLYFAQLWYFEHLYPLVFSAEAFRRLSAEQRDEH